jgi:hypothetical protein
MYHRFPNHAMPLTDQQAPSDWTGGSNEYSGNGSGSGDSGDSMDVNSSANASNANARDVNGEGGDKGDTGRARKKVDMYGTSGFTPDCAGEDCCRFTQLGWLEANIHGIQ